MALRQAAVSREPLVCGKGSTKKGRTKWYPKQKMYAELKFSPA